MSEKAEELLNSETGAAKPATESHGSKESGLLAAGPNAEQSNDDRARQEEEWRSELFRLENEMSTLRSVLVAKTKEADDLKKKLGITPLVEFKEDVKHGFHNVKESEPFQKTSAAFKDFGDFASKKLGDLRNSNAFKSVEEKVGGAYSSVKKKIYSSKSESENVEEAADSAEDVNSNATPPGISRDDYTALKP